MNRQPEYILTLLVAAVCAALALLPNAGVAQEEASSEEVVLKIGAVNCFRIRRPDGQWTPRQRAARVHTVFAKHLGHPRGNFSSRKRNGFVTIYLNGDFVINVTNADAKATGFRDAPALAAVWMAQLRKAFEDTHARPTPGQEP